MTPFDPSKCDHGTVAYGKAEWDSCENCAPEEYAAAMAHDAKFGALIAAKEKEAVAVVAGILASADKPVWPWVERFDRLECRLCGATYDQSHRPDCSESAASLATQEGPLANVQRRARKVAKALLEISAEPRFDEADVRSALRELAEDLEDI